MSLILCSIMNIVHHKKIKTMKKNKKSSKIVLHFSHRLSLALLGCLIVGSSVFVNADQFTTQINNLQNQNAATQANVNTLQLQATSYQDAINQLQLQMTDISNAIAASQSAQAQLQQEIQASQLKLAQEKQVLGADINAMYLNSQMTTIEELATSKNLSDFVDAQVYRSSVQTQVQSILTQVTQLENQLSSKKSQVDQLLKTQEAQQAQLNNDQQQQTQLLAYNQSQQTQYNQQIANNQSKIATLQAEQAAQLAALESSSNNNRYQGTGSYPWASAPCPAGNYPISSCGNYNWAYSYSSTPPYGAPVGPFDPWGYEYRNCTSYVAWKIANTSTNPYIGSLISGLGNAADWPGGAINRQIPVSHGTNPQVGDAAVYKYAGGYQGHVVYVEAVYNDGSILVSQYNAGENGTYSTATISASNISNLYFIHFPMH